MFRSTILFLCISAIWALPSSVGHPKSFPRKFKGPRIINGDRAQEGQFPWQAALSIDSFLSGWFCGGTIISEEWILTAGHCVDGALGGTVRTGTLDPNGGQSSDIAQFILHDGYNEDTVANDIGLIRLSSPLTLGGNTAAISLASEDLGAGVDVTVSGWGLTSDSSQDVSNVLYYVNLQTIDTSDCESYYGAGSILPEMVCAGAGNRGENICSGDSGGPVVLDAGSNPVHVAIVSFGSSQGCESGAPSGYTRTAYYRDWIKENSGI